MQPLEIAPPARHQAVEMLLSRASVSQLRDPAPEGRELVAILQAAMRAPDHGQLRPLRLVLIRNAARTRLADVTEAALRSRTPDVAEEVVQRQRKKLLNVPLIIGLGAHLRPDSKIPETEQILSVGAAAMNMLNAIHMLGFSGIWITGPNAYDPSVAAALGFTHSDRLLGFLFVGTAKEDARSAPKRPDPGDYTTEWTGE